MANLKNPVDEIIQMHNQGMNDSQVINKLTEEGFTPVQIGDALNQAKIKKGISAAEPIPPQVPANQGLTPSAMPMPPPQQSKPLYPPPPMPEIQPPPARKAQMPLLPSLPLQAQAPQQAPPQITPQPPIAQPPVPTPSSAPPMPPSQKPMAQQMRPSEESSYPYVYPTYDEAGAPPKIETEVIEEIAEEIVNEKWQEVKSKIGDVIEWKTYAEKRIVSVDERIRRLEATMDKLQVALLSKVNDYGRGIKDLGADMGSLEGALGKILSPLVNNIKELGKITDELKKDQAKTKKSSRK